jgi:hypothetical protein
MEDEVGRIKTGRGGKGFGFVLVENVLLVRVLISLLVAANDPSQLPSVAIAFAWIRAGLRKLIYDTPAPFEGHERHHLLSAIAAAECLSIKNSSAFSEPAKSPATQPW